METLSVKSQIKEAYSEFSEASYREKKSPLMTEHGINKFLAAINTTKEHLRKETAMIESLVVKGEKLTWLESEPDEEDMKDLSIIIAMLKDIHGSLIRQYVRLGTFRVKGIAKTEIAEFKLSVDDIKELYEDLENSLFEFPEMPEFIEANKVLMKL